MAGIIGLLAACGGRANGQPATFAGTAQHTAQYSPPAQRLNRVRWSTSIDLNNTGAYAHYGAPLITPANTVLVPIRTATGFKISAFEGATGLLKYSLTNDYTLPAHGWLPAYQPVLASSLSGTRLYYPGAGGTVYYIDNPDSDVPTTPVQQCFFTNITSYSNNAAAYNSTVFINTPITADANGVIFFGFRVQTNSVQTNAPAPLNTIQCGYARIDADGNSSYVLAGDAAADSQTTRVPHNCAPALSNDGATLYVTVKWTNDAFNAYLLGLDSKTLATKYKVLLRDPRNGNRAGVLDDGTASPMVAPDGDVFLGVYANPNNSSRGFLLHFTADLSTQKPPSAFGWDYTPAIVPANMVPSYTGPSSYLLFSKYNNYAGYSDGNGINRIALLDPNATQVDAHASAPGLVEMRELMTVIGCTPDNEYQGPTYPYAVREWCINTAAVNPATKSVFTPSEDGHIYRWNLALNALTEVFTLGPGVGEPYVPTVIGPDGTVYTLNGGTLFALSSLTNVAVAVYSSTPDLCSAVAGQPLTFTASVTNLNPSDPAPTGTVTFQDLTYRGLIATHITLATNVALTNGSASLTTSALLATSNYLGSHFITAIYSGDDNFPTGSATLVQKVHASATTTTLISSAPDPASNNAVTFTATIASNPAGDGTPTGMVSFWDGSSFLAQLPLKTNGTAGFASTNLSGGGHSLWASYCSDTIFASSTGNLIGTRPYLNATLSSDGSLQLAFTNGVGSPFTVLGSTNLDLPLSNWLELGAATEILPGQFQFTDLQSTNDTSHFYRVRSP